MKQSLTIGLQYLSSNSLRWARGLFQNKIGNTLSGQDNAKDSAAPSGSNNDDIRCQIHFRICQDKKFTKERFTFST
jgi:hypothetical protein